MENNFNYISLATAKFIVFTFFLHLLQGFVTLSKYFKWMNTTSTTKLLLFFHLKCVIANLKPVFFGYQHLLLNSLTRSLF